jgi:hypothetical protein
VRDYAARGARSRRLAEDDAVVRRAHDFRPLPAALISASIVPSEFDVVAVCPVQCDCW